MTVHSSHGGVAIGTLLQRGEPDAAPLTLVPPLGLRDPALPLRGRASGLRELTDLLDCGSDGRPHIVHGMGGCGKTSLALELAQTATERGVRVWWVDARQTALLEAGLNAVARQVGATEADLRAGVAADTLWRSLAADDRPWLLVVDNADDPHELDGPGSLSAGTGWVRRHTAPHGHVVITSRDGTRGTWGATAVLHPLDTLSDADGARVLLDHSGGRAGGAAEAESLARRLGGLPLALTLAGSYLSRATEIPEAFRDADTLTTFNAYREALDQGLDLVDSEQVIAQTWRFSLDLLSRRGKPLARPLLGLLATFADAPLPYTLLLHPPTLAATGVLPGTDGPALWDLLQALSGVGLVRLPAGAVRDFGVPLARVHPLIRDAVPAPADLPTAVRLLHRAVLDPGSGVPEDEDHWPQWQTLLPHALHLAHRAATAELPTEVVETALSCAQLAVRYLSARTLYEAARDESLRLLPRYEAALGPGHPGTLNTRHHLAHLLHAQGELEAARAEFEAVLAAKREALGADHESTLAGRHELGRVLHDLGDQHRARIELQEALAGEERVLGAANRYTVNTRHILARVLYDLGDTAAAQREFRAVYALRRRMFGAEHRETLATRYNLALILYDSGELPRTREELRTVLTAQTQRLGPEHRATLNTRYALACVCRGLGETATARDEFEAVLVTQRRVLGEGHPDTLATAHSLGHLGEASDDVPTMPFMTGRRGGLRWA
ncbi:tetratricopeptide repeat protein [Streptomyces sp. NPDC014864]|uniref:tetratricopeptide repeat protein n=1 Tax=Streptomyces sp. NPDC014864 TaxID=3364924 RepID=UPI0036FCC850